MKNSSEALISEVWAVRNAAHADFVDPRLNVRFGLVLSSFAARPLDSIPQASGGWGAAKATYRFINNKRISLKEMRQPMIRTTVESCRGRPTILSIEDTTTVSLTSLHKTSGLGPINDNPHARGLLLHSTMAMTPNGDAIGLLAQDGWARPKVTKTKEKLNTEAAKKRHAKIKAEKRKRPFEEKESYKWALGIQQVNDALKVLPVYQRPKVIHIFDREGDVHEVFQVVCDNDNNSAIIRAAWSRRIDGPERHAFDAVRASPILSTTTFIVPRKKDQKERQATVELRSCSVRLDPSIKHYPNRKQIPLNLVEVYEPNPPEGQTPLRWLLWTLEPVESSKQALAVVQAYRLRWTIEDVHLVLKSGCHIEKLQFDTANRILKVIALYTAVAIRIIRLRNQGRKTPDISCTAEFHSDEWRALYAHIHPKNPKPPLEIPTLKKMTLWVGRLGGHLGRKGDRMPGVKALWLGLRDLQILVMGYRAGKNADHDLSSKIPP